MRLLVMRGKFFGKKMKIEFAEAKIVSAEKSNVDRLLLMIAKYMGWGDDISHVFVSDESQLWDFNLSESELAELSSLLGFQVTEHDYIMDIALRMKPAN